MENLSDMNTVGEEISCRGFGRKHLPLLNDCAKVGIVVVEASLGLAFLDVARAAIVLYGANFARTTSLCR
jgi:hypothetical protein